MGAAGNGVPDNAAQKAWIDSTMEQAAGAGEWFVSHQGGMVSASIVREAPAQKAAGAHQPHSIALS